MMCGHRSLRTDTRHPRRHYQRKSRVESGPFGTTSKPSLLEKSRTVSSVLTQTGDFASDAFVARGKQYLEHEWVEGMDALLPEGRPRRGCLPLIGSKLNRQCVHFA